MRLQNILKFLKQERNKKSDLFFPSIVIISFFLFLIPILLEEIYTINNFNGDKIKYLNRDYTTDENIDISTKKHSTISYIVKPGENLWLISKKFAVDLNSLAEANTPGDLTKLRIGQVINIPTSKELIETEKNLNNNEEESINKKGAESQKPKKEGFLRTVHVVKEGESLWTIAKIYGIDIDTLTGANDDIDNKSLRVGQKLIILNQKGVLHKIKKGEALKDISAAYEISQNEIIRANNLAKSAKLIPGNDIFIPNAKSLKQSSRFIFPLTGKITDRFGYRTHPIIGEDLFHTGIDISAPRGRPIGASRSGRVTFSGWKGNYGKTIIIEHEGGYTTLYGHNSVNLVKEGQYVKRGQVIAKVGDTGLSTGYHLHFEISKGRKIINPLLVLK